MIEQRVAELRSLADECRTKGTRNGGSLGFHSGLLEQAADAISSLLDENRHLRAELEDYKKEN